MPNLFEQEYTKLNWKSWQYEAGNFKALKNASRPIPLKHGVYIIRSTQSLSRVLGCSDVVYIGQSGGKPRGGKQGIGPGNNSLRRLFNTRNPEKWVRERIEELFPDKIFRVECYFTSSEDPKEVEQALLRACI